MHPGQRLQSHFPVAGQEPCAAFRLYAERLERLRGVHLAQFVVESEVAYSLYMDLYLRFAGFHPAYPVVGPVIPVCQDAQDGIGRTLSMYFLVTCRRQRPVPFDGDTEA